MMTEPLSPAWTKKLFKLLREKYGSQFDGDENEWSQVLAGVSGEGIKRGLAKCHESVPSAQTFRDLCKPEPVQVPAGQPMGNKQWAVKLKQRYLDGEHLSAIQISYAEAVVGKFRLSRHK